METERHFTFGMFETDEIAVLLAAGTLETGGTAVACWGRQRTLQNGDRRAVAGTLDGDGGATVAVQNWNH